MIGMPRLHRLAAAALALAAFVPATAHGGGFTAEVIAQRIDNFRIGSSQTRFGALEFAGGLVMASANRHFGAVSSFRFLDGTGTRFAAVADTGFFITGTVERDGEGRPAAMGLLNFTELPDMKGRISKAKWETDAEALVVEDGRVVIGFERRPRLGAFAFDGTVLGLDQDVLPQPIPLNELRGNQSFEALARAPDDGPLAGALVLLTEGSVDAKGNIFAAVTSGPREGIFTVAAKDTYLITDADFLPDGDLLILERSFSMATGIRMRLRKIDVAMIAPGAIVDGETLIEATLADQIDNMEGLDVWRAPDGGTRISLFSDDNKSILQRNLYLEFKLIP
jgi:hypothetical protein